MTIGGGDRGLALNERRRLSLDRGILFAFLLLGSVGIVALKLASVHVAIRIGVPVALILAYAALTVFRTRFRLRYDQVGDNCYYMGFIFTLVSLGVALYYLRGGVSVQDYGISVVRDFGLALTTTVTGIILRVTLSQLREDPHDIEEATRRELIEYSRMFSGQMRASIGMLIDLREDTEDRLKNFAFEMAQVVKEHQTRAEEMRTATQSLADGIKTLADDLSSTEIPTGKLREAATSALQSIEQLNSSLAKANKGLAEVENSSRQVAEVYKQASVSGAMLQRQEEGIAQARTAGAEASQELTVRIASLTTSIASATETTAVFKELAEEAKAVAEAMRTATRSIAGANSRLAAAEAGLATQLETVQRAAKALAAQIEVLAAAKASLGEVAASTSVRTAT